MDLMPDIIVDYRLPCIRDQFFLLFFKGLDEEGDPKGKCTFLFLLLAFCVTGISGGNALSVLPLAC